MMKAVALVPAAGSGTRMGGRQPKQYLLLGGAPLLVHTIRALARCPSIEGAVVAVSEDRIGATQALLRRFRVPRVLAVVAGGEERQDSVRLGLETISSEAAWVVVHDAVRPMVTPDLVERVLAAARIPGAATCGWPVRETVKMVQDSVVAKTLPRDGLWLTQTPQAFRRELLREAHDKAVREGFRGTDDAMLVERLGGRVAMVEGLARNIKITTPEDLKTVRMLLGSRR
ncbi:MAG TPA: 2-C-methyl-D-erythritol 4-phosphate cytidylyltransferase [Methylomirabilota bacterium]|jgi:2-C-methyl-D-erythritol 4-phosphate cytidylyltransferase|nr:2-C-methyl-D-erythritol 4-phosphate cytidylyltransferase [Methylomirabilota bacterium]